MTTDPFFHRLLEMSWRRKLTEAEVAELNAWLAAHPDAQTDWQVEAGLNELLERLPDVPVPSNFTARVLAQAQRPNPPVVAKGLRFWSWRLNWLTRGAFAALVVGGAGWFAYHQHQERRLETELVNSLFAVSKVASMPSPHILTNFAAIQLMSAASSAPGADVQLLSLMQ